MLTFQEIILKLQQYWSDRDCSIIERVGLSGGLHLKWSQSVLYGTTYPKVKP